MQLIATTVGLVLRVACKGSLFSVFCSACISIVVRLISRCMHLHRHQCVHACMYICMHACIYACMHVYMHACVHMRAYMHACMHAYVNNLSLYLFSFAVEKQRTDNCLIEYILRYIQWRETHLYGLSYLHLFCFTSPYLLVAVASCWTLPLSSASMQFLLPNNLLHQWSCMRACMQACNGRGLLLCLIQFTCGVNKRLRFNSRL